MNKRLLKLIEYYGLNINSFSIKIGVKEGTIRKVITSNTSLRTDTLVKISQSFTNVNIDWLVIGRGSMFYKNTENSPLLQPSESQVFESLLQKNENLIRENQNLKIQLEEAQKKLELSKSESAPMENSFS